MLWGSDLVQSHWCIKAFLLQPWLTHSHRSFEVNFLPMDTCYHPDITMATGASRCTCSGMGLFSATDTQGVPVPCGLIRRSRSPWPESALESQQQQWPGHVPAGSSPVLLSKCSRHNRVGDKQCNKQWKQEAANGKHKALMNRQESRAHGKHRSVPINI